MCYLVFCDFFAGVQGMISDNGGAKFPIRVLMTIGRLNIGGAERRLLQLCSHLQANQLGVEVSIFVISGAEGQLDACFRKAGVSIYYGQPGLKGLVAFSALVRRTCPDIVHVNAGSAAGFYCLAGRIGGVRKAVSHIRSCGPLKHRFFSRYALLYEPLTSVLSDVVIGVSSATRENRNFSKKNWRVIYNGIDPSEIEAAIKLSEPSDFSRVAPNFVILGRLDRLKNVRHGIRAFSRYFHEQGGGRG